MSRSMGDLATELRTIAGFDVTQDTAMAWLNERQGLMIARARALRQLLELAATDGSGTIEAPDLVELYRLRIDGVSYDKVPKITLEDLRACRATVSPPGLVWASEAGTTAGDGTFEVWPTPAAGLAVEIYAAVRAPEQDESDTPLVPAEFVSALVEGAIATGLAYDTEQVASADRFETRFDSKCEEYRRWVARQYRGAGPTQMRVKGVNA